MSKQITVEELHRELENGSAIQLIDVRSPGEFAAGHVPTASLIPLEEVESRLDDIRTDRSVVVLCQSGQRANMACERITQTHPNAVVVTGGTQAWISRGYPVVRQKSHSWSLERQVRLIAGILILAGTSLSLILGTGWVYLAMFVGAGLTLAGLTQFCGMAKLLAVMPWNRPKKISGSQSELGVQS